MLQALYIPQYTRQLRRSFIVSTEVLNRFDQVCKKCVSPLAETPSSSISIHVCFVHIEFKVILSPYARHEGAKQTEVQLNSFSNSAQDKHEWSIYCSCINQQMHAYVVVQTHTQTHIYLLFFTLTCFGHFYHKLQGALIVKTETEWKGVQQKLHEMHDKILHNICSLI
jgi:hypothetical protein